MHNRNERLTWIMLIAVALGLTFGCGGCKQDPNKQTKTEEPTTSSPKPQEFPSFNGDSAYHYVAKQLTFGPRVPGSDASRKCREWMVAHFEKYGADVIVQPFTAKRHDGVPINGENIIASYNPQSTNRIIIGAHWDSRYMAEEDEDPAMTNTPIPGADDGASGTGVIMEIARLLHEVPLNTGVDLILFDAEDQGISKANSDYTWCLGSQHWAKNLHKPGYSAKFGILLDMVGSRNARFLKEGFSVANAPRITNKVWTLANKMGYGNYFLNINGDAITDDHRMVMEFAKIPMINIINRSEETDTGFGPHWHTHGDDMDVISKRTLRSVGRVVTATIYNNSIGKF